MSLDQALARFATAMGDTSPTQRLRMRVGVVDAVSSGSDGEPLANVQIGDDIIPSPRLESYDPGEGDTVAVLLIDGAPLVLGRIVGLPDLT